MRDAGIAVDVDLAIAARARAGEQAQLDDLLKDDSAGFFSAVLYLLNR